MTGVPLLARRMHDFFLSQRRDSVALVPWISEVKARVVFLRQGVWADCHGSRDETLKQYW